MFCCSPGGGRTLGQFALVSYIPGQLGCFLDDLRNELTPGCDPRAHVTILPPRPMTAEICGGVKELANECFVSTPFDITLGEIEIFRKSNVIYLGIERGVRELHALHENLNSGQLEYDGPFPFHPHVTIAQELAEEQSRVLAEIARERWAAYTGPRTFTVETLAFVQNVAPHAWLDIARLPLAVPVAAH